MNTQKIILKVFLFVVVNIVLVLLHLEAFRSNIPFLAFCTAGIHIIGLILYPYKKMFLKK